MSKTARPAVGHIRHAIAAISLAACAATFPASAQTPPQPPPPPGLSMQAFQTAYATSLYGFDACGDQLAGRIFRNALAEKFAACPFSAEARAHFRQWATAQRAKSARFMSQLVEQNGGLPVKLDGMTLTCHEQHATPDYLAFRAKLESYAKGEITADALLPAPCDAPVIAP